MYDELVKSLRMCGRMTSIDDNCISYVNGCCEAFPDCAYALMDKAADAIEELSKPRWIPVTERLPDAESGDISERVLVTDGKDFAIVEWFNFEESFWGYTGFGEDVTHWMPLPDPPKEE